MYLHFLKKDAIIYSNLNTLTYEIKNLSVAYFAIFTIQK